MTLKRLVDAHHHLWDLDAVHYPWLMEKGVVRFFGDPAPIQKNYLPADLRTDIGQLPITKTVHIQVGAADGLQEHQWVARQAAEQGIPAAIIAFADLAASDHDTVLDPLSESPHFRGVRQIVGRSSEEDKKTGTASLISDPAFEAGLRALHRRGLSFDLQLIPEQMQDTARLLGTLPDLPVALCHAGSLSDFSADGTALWRSGLEALAAHAPMICKISGFGMFNHTWTIGDIRDYVLTVIDIFTPARVAFGSNFPVDKLYSSYSALWAAYLDITKDFSDSERDAMFAGTAEQFYRI